MLSDATRDEYFMGLALAEAHRAARAGEVPVGAVVVAGEMTISRGRNAVVGRNDPTAHAEVVALRRACRKRANFRLTDCDLFVTLEPCALCLGAIVQARVRRLVFGAWDPKSGAVASVMTFPFGKLNHRPRIVAGVRAEECGRVLKDFFRARRARKQA
ncbi:MAG: tRNA-specific adenosine deaminase [Candidatus Aminicenantes bacterium RBG_13_63_10]|nr:MAG: tRNA-specific adenosine deaminase [Candidatus Aminicenantes bacterium RBG_13_63_10]